ncbi:MAG: YIP1 family protein [Nitrospirota bacterium]|nr:YIP1 family protein [Nitrospirota bacterium]
MEGQQKKSIDFAAMPQTAIKVVTSPAAFFRDMQKTGGFVEPLVFMVIMGVISGIIQAVLSILHLNVIGGIGAGISTLIFMPIALAVFGFIGAGIAFVIWKVMGSQESFETAYRCVAYTTALSPITTVLGVIPYLGSALGILLGTYYIVIASVEVHKIALKKAWTVFGIIAAVFILINISGQFAARKLSREAEQLQKQMEETATQMQENIEASQKAAEEAAKAAESMNEEMQKNQELQSEEMKKAADEMQKQLDEMKKRKTR